MHPDPLATFAAAAQHAALFTDFDGTLSDIVADPADARPHGDAADLLGILAGRLAIVCVLSGRPIAFLEPFFPDPAIRLVGLYGLEQRIGGARIDLPGAGVWREVVADTLAAAGTGPAGMRAEGKGLSLTLHYREHPEIEDAVATWAAGQARRTGLVARRARMSVELHPPIEVDKGSVLRAAVEAADQASDEAGGAAIEADVGGDRATGEREPTVRAVCFMGDDAGDLTAYDALDALAATGRHTVRVAAASPEAVPELLARADVTVDGPGAVVAILRELVGATAPRR